MLFSYGIYHYWHIFLIVLIIHELLKYKNWFDVDPTDDVVVFSNTVESE